MLIVLSHVMTFSSTINELQACFSNSKKIVSQCLNRSVNLNVTEIKLHVVTRESERKEERVQTLRFILTRVLNDLTTNCVYLYFFLVLHWFFLAHIVQIDCNFVAWTTGHGHMGMGMGMNK